MPTVTVLILNYNHARFLEQRIQSVLRQTYQDFEIIYLDDASNDHSAEVFAPYSCDERIRSIINTTNSGNPFKQWNKGVGAARGEYIWIAEADDYADECFLERLVTALEAHPSAGVAYCQSMSVDEQGRPLGTMQWWTRDLNATRWQHDFFNNGPDECKRYLANRNTIPNASGVLFRRQVYLEAGGADENMRLCGDWKCWVNCLLRSDVVYVAEALNFFRSHDRSVRQITELNGILCLENYRMLAFIGQQCAITPSMRRNVLRRQRNQWLFTLFSIPWKRNLQIYGLASRLDRDIRFHLFRKILRKTFGLWLKSRSRIEPQAN
ncbi:glycosyltransferase family 2 protein [bacterium]|nr:MAG: glycosyltransferase family 2 protein [bacterium]